MMREALILIGWTIWLGDGPARSIRGTGWRRRREPVKVYKTEKVAARYGSPVPVYVKVADTPDT